MELKDEREVEVTREKLHSLEERYESVARVPGDDAHVQELTLRSLKRMINQMKEAIAPTNPDGPPAQASRPSRYRGRERRDLSASEHMPQHRAGELREPFGASVVSRCRVRAAVMPPSPQSWPCSTYSRNESPVSRVR